MKIEWSAFSIADRKAIFDFIEVDNPPAATEIDLRIKQSVEELLHFPEIGRQGRIHRTRELVISRTPYLAAYRIEGDVVRILRILHGAQQWPEEIPEIGLGI
jgi:toxin ParE1/3/4